MFSDSRVKKLAKEFVCVKVDPRDPNRDREAMAYKSTRYVPDVVFVSPEGEELGSLRERTAEGAAAELEAVLARVKGASR